MVKFNWRVFISLNLLFTILVIAISGIVLYFKPEGSVARWLDWRFLFLDKSTWESVHTIFSYLFLLFALFHVLDTNIKSISEYFSSKGRGTHKELSFALLISILFLAGSVFKVKPFHWVFEAGDILSATWEQSYEFPEGHINARTTLGEFAEYNDVPVDTIYVALEKQGLEQFSSETSFLEVGRKNDISPFAAYEILMPFDSESDEDNKGGLSLADIAFILDKDEAELVDTLDRRYENIELTKSTKLEELSDETGKSVSSVRREIVNILH
ncbi:MAG: DUF4405 domain-containing protein [Bacteroidales bacterium]